MIGFTTRAAVRTRLWILVALVVAAVCASLLSARPDPAAFPAYNGVGRLGPFAWAQRLDVTYARPADGFRAGHGQHLQAHARRLGLGPGSGAVWPGPYPAILLIHGGGWDGGTNAVGAAYTGYSGSWCQIWASWGFVAYSVGYRLRNGRPGNDWPAQLVDVQAAVRWVRARASGDNPDHVDKRWIGAMGDSAGGSLAMQVGSLSANVATGEDPVARTEAGWSPRVDFVVSAFGPFNWGPRSEAAPRPHGALEMSVAALAASGHGPAGAAPPSLFIQGRNDRTVPWGSSSRPTAR